MHINASYCMRCKLWYKQLLMLRVVMDTTANHGSRGHYSHITKQVVASWQAGGAQVQLATIQPSINRSDTIPECCYNHARH
jgi:hypothetical protein